MLVEGRKALVGPDGRYTVPEGASWSDDVAQGIFRSADLEVFPAVYVSDTVVRTSVEDRTLSYDVSRHQRDRRARSGSPARPWDPRTAPAGGTRQLPARDVVVPADTTTTVTVGPLPGGRRRGVVLVAERAVPGRLPRPAARPGRPASTRASRPIADTPPSHVRFGFREIKQVGDHFELNGRRVNFRGDSIQGANYDNIDFHGVSDAYDTLPGLPRALVRATAAGRRRSTTTCA